MKKRTTTGAIPRTLLVIATASSVTWCSQARAQTAQPGAAATPAVAATPGAAGAQQDPFTVENLIGDAVSLSNQPYPDVDNAIKRFKNSDVAGAREFLEIALQKHPKLPPVDLMLAKLQVFARNGQEARQLLEATVTKNSTDPEAYLLLADLAFAEGRTTEAHALFDKASTLVPKFTDNTKRQQNFQIRVLAGLAAVHERRLQWAEALDLLTKWVELDPDSAAAHTRLGVTLFRVGKTAEALAEFQKARELRPDSNHPQVVMGQLYTQDKQIDKARAAFELAYKEDQKSETTARAYADWLVLQDELDKAQQVAATMRKNAPESVTALMLDGIIAKMRNEPKAAEEALTKVLGIDPSNAGATNLLALILTDSANSAEQEKALRYAQVNAERFPTSSQANITLAWILAKLGRTADSDAYLTKAVQAGNLNADSAYLVAKILVQKGQRDNARQALEQVLTQAGAGMFMYRDEAEALVKELGGTVPEPAVVTPVGADAAGATGVPATTSPPPAGQ